MTKQEFADNIQRRIDRIQSKTAWITDNWEKLEAAGVSAHLLDPFTCPSIDIDKPTRENVMAVIQAFPGVWEKSDCGVGGTISYERQIQEGLTLRLWAAPPPPTCRVVEEWVDVPASRVRRLTLHCGPDLPTALPAEATALPTEAA